jgi:hypothetical protein
VPCPITQAAANINSIASIYETIIVAACKPHSEQLLYPSDACQPNPESNPINAIGPTNEQRKQ